MSGEGAVGLAVVGVIGGGVLVASRVISGGVLVASHAVTGAAVTLGTGLVVAADGAARLATSATGLLGTGLAAIGDRSDAAYQRWQQEQQAAAVWECAAREVVVRNARIAVVRAHAADDPALHPLVPPTFVLNGQPVDELRAWADAADRALADAEEAMAARARRAVHAFLGSVLASAPGPGGPAPEELPEQEALGRFHALRDRGAPAARLADDTAVEVARVVDRLVADAADADRARVLAAAAAVVTRHGADRRSQLDELRERVRRANESARAARDARHAAAVYLQALEGSSETGLRARLADVVAGRRELDLALDAEARQECARVREVEEIAYIRRRATEALESLGYAVDTGFSTHVGTGDRLRLVRDDWTEHAVGVVLDGAELRTSVIRTAARDGDDAVRVDVEREEQWCEAFAVLQTELADAGLAVEVTHLKHPGERPVPVAAARRPDARHAGQQRRRNDPS